MFFAETRRKRKVMVRGDGRPGPADTLAHTSTPATEMDFTLPVPPPLTPHYAFYGVLVALGIADAAGIVVVGRCRSIGWVWGCRGRGGILDFESRLRALGVGGGGTKFDGMIVGREELVGKEEDEGVRVDTDWSNIPAFNSMDVSSDWDWIFCA
ncbi:hypothetical protein BJ165DRAFT_757257 [Panaeolus papilionaceus]|nr:hypothetical protein BJ165DRAFT_757257 [Panaeolus papilionaceus]